MQGSRRLTHFKWVNMGRYETNPSYQRERKNETATGRMNVRREEMWKPNDQERFVQTCSNATQYTQTEAKKKNGGTCKRRWLKNENCELCMLNWRFAERIGTVRAASQYRAECAVTVTIVSEGTKGSKKRAKIRTYFVQCLSLIHISEPTRPY